MREYGSNASMGDSFYFSSNNVMCHDHQLSSTLVPGLRPAFNLSLGEGLGMRLVEYIVIYGMIILHDHFCAVHILMFKFLF